MDRLRLPRLRKPFAVLAIAFDPDVRKAAVDELEEALVTRGASPVIFSAGPGADLWDEGVLSMVPDRRLPAEGVRDYFHSGIVGFGMDVTEFVVLCLDGDEAEFQAVIDATRATLHSTADWRLHAAAAAGRVHEVRRAIADGWPVDEFDDELAETPLHKAAREEDLEIARMLLEAGADVNKHSEERIGETPLGAVADTCSVEMARLLMQAGADPTIPGWMMMSALDRAADRTDEVGRQVHALLREGSRRGGD